MERPLPNFLKVSETEKTARTQLGLRMSLGKILSSCPLNSAEPFYHLTDSLDPLNTAVTDVCRQSWTNRLWLTASIVTVAAPQLTARL